MGSCNEKQLIAHGQSVSLGLEFAARFSLLNLISHKQRLYEADWFVALIQLPVCYNIHMPEVFNALTKDKKKNGSVIDFIF